MSTLETTWKASLTLSERVRNHTFHSLLIFINLALIMAVWSYSSKDAIAVSGGSEMLLWNNWLGQIGAYVSYALVMLFGFGAYLFVILVAICSLRHFLGRTYGVSFAYLLALVIILIGLTMLLGAFPKLLPSLQERVNLGEIPGGAIGSALCHPKHGWLNLIMNRTGSLMLSMLFLTVGFGTVWFFDWHGWFKKKSVMRSVSRSKKKEEKRELLADSAASEEYEGDNGPGDVFSEDTLDEFDDQNVSQAVEARRELKIKPEQDDTVQDSARPTLKNKKKPSALTHGMKTLMGWMRVKPGQKVGEREMEFVDSDDFCADTEEEAKVYGENYLPAVSDAENDSQEPLAADEVVEEVVTVADLPRQEVPESLKAPAEEDVEPKVLKVKAPTPQQQSSGHGDFALPSLPLMRYIDEGNNVDAGEVENKRRVIQDTLDSFKLKAVTGGAFSGPRVTLFEVVPEKGIRVEKVANLSNNFAMELEAESVRILAPIPGKRSIGIEVPNDTPSTVCFRRLVESPKYQKSKGNLPIVLGKDISGDAVIMDLAKAPHLLVAGATGAGKSVFMNTLILSLLYRFSPDELQLILVDPKVVEFAPYSNLPHLVCPVITDPKRVPSALRWAVFEMELRYQMLAKVGVRNLEDFNKREIRSDSPKEDDYGNPIPNKIPYTVIIIDELADLMMVAKADIETSIARIAQKARAVGIHLVLATQRPSVNVITGLIKANFPTRISFQVTSNVDSKTILDRKGAEMLLGKGDMLFMPPGTSNLMRVQAAFVPDADIEAVVNHCADQQEQDFRDIFKTGEGSSGDGGQENSPALPGFEADENDEDEKLIQEALRVIIRDKRASTSHVQRRLRIGYNRAALIMEALEERGHIGPAGSGGKREILTQAEGEE